MNQKKPKATEGKQLNLEQGISMTDPNTYATYFKKDMDTKVNLLPNGRVEITQVPDNGDDVQVINFSFQRWDEVRDAIDNMVLDFYNRKNAELKKEG